MSCRPFFIKYIVSAIVAILFSVSLFAQNFRLSGKVIDEKNNPIAGAKIAATGGPKTITDVEGRFTLLLVADKKYEIEISALGFITKLVGDVSVSKKQSEELQVVLDVNVSNLEAITVKTSSKKETVNALIQFQKNTNTVAQVISAEAIKKSPDRNTGEVLKRVPGVSLQEGKYLIVRGLPDRYNQATLNGALMASSEPDRKTFSFDIFPSSIVDNIIINKAATPEMPGEFAGGLVQIVTKDVPDRSFLEMTLGSGVNLQVLKNDFYSYKGGKLDFLGIDNGARKLPGDFPSVTTINTNSGAANAALGAGLSDIWSGSKASKPVNATFQVNGGFNKRLSGSRSFGGVFSVNYNSQSRYSEIDRYNYDMQREPLFASKDKQYVTNTMAGALANLTYRSGSNKFSWKNTYNINGYDQYTSRVQQDINGNVITDITSQELSFVSNRLLSSQLIGEHVLKGSGLRIKWNGNFAQLKQDVPDLRRLKYTKDNNGDYYANVSTDGNPNNAGRFNSKLKDDIYGGSLDLSRSFDWFGNQQQIKIGGLYQRKKRIFDSRGLSMILGNLSNMNLLYLPPSEIFSKDNYAADKFLISDKTVNADSYIGNANLYAGYLQFDNQFGNKLRLVWGARVESFKQELSGRNYGVTSSNNATDVLPSVNLTYKLNVKTNLRVTASQSVSRPEFRELSKFSFYDFARNGAVTGNNNLQRTKITNADIRYELYPRSGELLTLGVFYKFFDKPIEMNYDIGQGSPLYGFWNAKSAVNYGIEADIRKRLDFITSGLEEFTFFANAALIRSKISVPDGYLGESERPMQGQSPYVVNAGLQFDRTKWGTNATVLFNVIGRRIAQIGNQNVPQIWENPRPLLDLQISQSLSEHASLKLSVTDILNKKGIFYWDLDNNKKYNPGKSADQLINQMRYGTNMNLQFTYTF